MTIEELAKQAGVSVRTIQRKIRSQFGPDAVITPSAEAPEGFVIEPPEDLFPIPPRITTPATSASPPAPKTKKPVNLQFLAVLPLPMLGLAAAYGVFFFASQFVPVVVAGAEAFAFELTYIGLAAMQGLPEKQQEKARRVSIGAVIVSVIYNTLAGAIHRDPAVMDHLPPVLFWAAAILHGAPLAILAYFVSDLIFHSKPAK